MDKKSDDKKVVVAPEVTEKAAEKKVVKAPEPTNAEKIWDEIKDANMEMFSLPGQTVEKYCRPMPVEPSKLYLVVSVAAALPALEVALDEVTKLQQKFRRPVHRYVVGRTEKYVTVSYAPEV